MESTFERYCNSYSRIKLERREGVVLATLHQEGDSFEWCRDSMAQLTSAFMDIALDRDNKVMILTGAGDAFTTPKASKENNLYRQAGATATPMSLYVNLANDRRMLQSFFEIEIPIIAAVNGPVYRHGELALMCDIVIASETASFEDTAHFHLGDHVPGDGINIVLTLLLGLNRARYLMLTGQVLGAQEARTLGLVSEIHPRAQLLDRAWELATSMAHKSELLLRHSKKVLIHPLKKQFDDHLSYYLSLEAASTVDSHGSSN